MHCKSRPMKARHPGGTRTLPARRFLVLRQRQLKAKTKPCGFHAPDPINSVSPGQKKRGGGRTI